MTEPATPKAWLPHPGPAPASRWTPTQLGALALVVALSAALAWFSRLGELTTGGDESMYVLLSRSLAEGHYRDTYLPNAPLHAHYPPGMPAWLLLIRGVLGPALDMARAANLVVVLTAGVLLADGLRRLGQAWAGVGAAALVLWNPSLLQITMTLHSEALFIFLSVLAVWAALRADQSSSPGWVILAVVAAMASFLTRTAGVGVLAGIGLWTLASRRWWVAVAFGVASAAVVLGWFAYLRAATPHTVAVTYLVDLGIADRGPGAVLHRVSQLIVFYLGTALPSMLNLPMLADTPADNVAWLLLIGACVLVGTVLLFQTWSAVPGVLLGGTLVLLGWIYKVDRLLMAVLPWLAVGTLVGAGGIERRLRGGGGIRAALALWAILAGSALVGSVERLRAVQQCERRDQFARPGCVEDGERGFMMAIRALPGLLPPGAVVATVKPSVLAYSSGLRAVPVGNIIRNPDFSVQEDGSIHRGGATHILLSRFTDVEQGRLARALRPYCHQLHVVAEIVPGVRVLTLRTPGDPGDACAALHAIPDVPQGQD